MAEAEVPTPRFYERTYKDLKARRDALLSQAAGMDPVLEGLERLIKESGSSTARPPRRPRTLPKKRRQPRSTVHRRTRRAGGEGLYSKLELIDAAENCLTVTGPQTNQHLADLLLAGGVRTKAKNFPATLNSTLSRDKARERGIGKVNGKWTIQK